MKETQVLGLHFKSKAHQSKFLRHMKQGKGMVIRHDMIHGGSLWGSIVHGIEHVVSNPIVKSVAGIAAPIAGQMLTDSGHPLLGTATTAGLQAYSGSGVRKRGRHRKGGSLLNTLKKVAPIVKRVLPVVAPVVAQQVSDATGSPFAGNVAGAVLNSAGSGIHKKRGRPKKHEGGGIKGKHKGKKSLPVPLGLELYNRSYRRGGCVGGSFAPL